MRLSVALPFLLLLSSPLLAKDNLGVFEDWGAFRDPNVPRCYAIAVPAENERARDYQPFASIGTWPRRSPAIRNQLHIRLSREMREGSDITLRMGRQSFSLTGGGGDAWALARDDAAIVAAIRSAGEMHVSARDTGGRLFTDSYSLAGAATAMDAATVGCARS